MILLLRNTRLKFVKFYISKMRHSIEFLFGIVGMFILWKELIMLIYKVMRIIDSIIGILQLSTSSTIIMDRIKTIAIISKLDVQIM